MRYLTISYDYNFLVEIKKKCIQFEHMNNNNRCKTESFEQLLYWHRVAATVDRIREWRFKYIDVLNSVVEAKWLLSV